MSEPLKDKCYTDNEGYQVFGKESIESALEWMIEQHEEKIEELIKNINVIDENSPYFNGDGASYLFDVIDEINREYESIMILEEGLSDVI